MTNNSLRFQNITFTILSPFDTYIFLDIDKLKFANFEIEREKVIKALNEKNIEIGNKSLRIEWIKESIDQHRHSGSEIPLLISEDEDFQLSFIMGKLDQHSIKDIEENFKNDFKDDFPESSLEFSEIKFYIQPAGVCEYSIKVKLKKQDGFNIFELKKASDKLYELFFIHFRDICYEVALKYIEIIESVKIPRFYFEWFTDLKTLNNQKIKSHILPWAHRVCHIHDDSLFKMREPIRNFKILLTPVSKTDIKDDSLYDDRYFYFGWSNSLILTSTQFFETEEKPEEKLGTYIDLIQVSQANYRSIEMLIKLIDRMIVVFNVKFKDLEFDKIKEFRYTFRDFNVGVNRMLDMFSYIERIGLVDTEKRALLLALNDRWNTPEMYNKLYERSKMLDSLLQDYYQRLKEKRDESLNTIVLLFTMMNLIEIFGTIFSILSTDLILSSIIQIIILITGTMSIGLMISLYFKLSRK